MLEPGGSEHLYLSDVSPQDKPWDKHRANATAVQALYQGSDFQRYADRIEKCSQWLLFAFEAQDSGELKGRLREVNFCRVRHCPVCQWRRALMWRARFFQAVPRIMQTYPTGRWVFITLTVRNCPVNELRATLGEMNKAWERMTKRKLFPALGFVKSVEVTRSEVGEAHPHFHCLMLVPSSYFSGKGYITQTEWRDLWQQALRADYLPVVNVKAVKPRFSKVNTISHALLETLKYGVKEDDLMHDAAWLQGITKELHKTRAISVGGVLRQYINEEEPEDLIHAEGEEESEEESSWTLVFEWLQVVKRYAKR